LLLLGCFFPSTVTSIICLTQESFLMSEMPMVKVVRSEAGSVARLYG
jgi:hypothetical protein